MEARVVLASFMIRALKKTTLLDVLRVLHQTMRLSYQRAYRFKTIHVRGGAQIQWNTTPLHLYVKTRSWSQFPASKSRHIKIHASTSRSQQTVFFIIYVDGAISWNQIWSKK